MLWRGAKSFGKEADIFLGTFPTGNHSGRLSCYALRDSLLGIHESTRVEIL